MVSQQGGSATSLRADLGNQAPWRALRGIARFATSALQPGRGLAAVIAIATCLALWQASTYLGVNAALFPPPTRVVAAMVHMFAREHFAADILASSRRLAVGYLAGAACALCVGLITGRYAKVAAYLNPVIQMMRPIPPISFVPIAIFWFGLGEFAKYFLVFWGVFFPVWINVHLGVTSVSDIHLRAAECLGARERHLLLAIVFPAALPMILAGLRTAIPISFYTLVAAEIAGAYSGVAYRIDVAHLDFRVGHMFAGLVVLGVMSALADRLFVVAARRLFPWAHA